MTMSLENVEAGEDSQTDEPKALNSIPMVELSKSAGPVVQLV